MEYCMNIRAIKFKTGEEIVAEVKGKGDKFKVINPITIQMAGGSLQPMIWFPWSESRTFTFNEETDILLNEAAGGEIVGIYGQLFDEEQRVIMPEEKKIITG